MWCKKNGCMCYDKKNDKCTRIGKSGDNKGVMGICWMDRSESEY